METRTEAGSVGMDSEEKSVGEKEKIQSGSSYKPDPIMNFFSFKHLPPALQPMSQAFAAMAESIHGELPDNDERKMALRKLLEAKDCAVRALIKF